MPSPTQPTMGLLAAWGDYPLVVARALKAQGYRTYCLGVVGHANPALADVCEDFRWIGIGKMGQAIRYFKRHAVHEATMAGKFHKVILFQPRFLIKLVPDWRSICAFFPHFWSYSRDSKDDSLLGTIVREFARDGITFGPATHFVPELLVKRGQLTRLGPSAVQCKDIAFGWKLAKELGRLDIGQSVAVKGLAPLAVEAVEGTDQCILRAGQLCPSGDFTVVKVAKPKQDIRFDMPTIGVGTLRSMAQAGAKVLAVEAGQTIILDEPAVVAEADGLKIVIVAVDSQGEFAA